MYPPGTATLSVPHHLIISFFHISSLVAPGNIVHMLCLKLMKIIMLAVSSGFATLPFTKILLSAESLCLFQFGTTTFFPTLFILI